MKELTNKCPYCGTADKLELIANIPTTFKLNSDGYIDFSVSNAVMINKIDALLQKFNEYKVKGHCKACDEYCKCIITKDKTIIFVKEEDKKNE